MPPDHVGREREIRALEGLARAVGLPAGTAEFDVLKAVAAVLGVEVAPNGDAKVAEVRPPSAAGCPLLPSSSVL